MSDEVTQTAWEVDALLAWFRDQQLPQAIADDAVRIVQDAIAEARREGATEALTGAADAWIGSDDPNAWIKPDRWLRDRAAALRGDA